MEVVKTHIVYKKDLFGGKFIKVFETSDGKYFREMGSGDGMWAQYEQIMHFEFEQMKNNYNKKVV
jgi:hypothetical protein